MADSYVPLGTTKTHDIQLTWDAGYTLVSISQSGSNAPWNLDLGACAAIPSPQKCTIHESYAPTLPGYFSRTPDQDWAPFVPLAQIPTINWNDPNLRFLDLDGYGLPDVLITEADAFLWYRSRAKDGLEPAMRVRQPLIDLMRLFELTPRQWSALMFALLPDADPSLVQAYRYLARDPSCAGAVSPHPAQGRRALGSPSGLH